MDLSPIVQWMSYVQDLDQTFRMGQSKLRLC